MNERSIEFYIDDILKSIDKIETRIAGMSIDTFKADEFLMDGVIRNLEIIGEAAKYVPKETRAKYKELPWKQIIGMRNIASHGYFKIDPEIVWTIITKDLANLKSKAREIKDLLHKNEDNNKS